MRDITERERAEEALRQARENLERLVEVRTARLQEAVTEMEHMSYSITHDMRAPLRAIQSFAGILEEEAGPALSEAHRDYLERMKTAAGRMDALIRDVLTYGYIVRKDQTIEPVNVASLLQSLIQTYPEFQAHDADLHIDPDIPCVQGNVALLTQCFSNLLGNALKFTRPGNKPKIRVNGRRDGRQVTIAISDNGMGIPETMREKIFGMFERGSAEQEGTGMGLAIVRKAVERMGGSISVESRENEGSTFYLQLRSVENQEVA